MVGVLIETTNSYNVFIVNFPHPVIARSFCDEAIYFVILAKVGIVRTLTQPAFDSNLRGNGIAKVGLLR